MEEQQVESLAEQQIREIQQRASDAGASMAAILETAGVDSSTWWRWRQWAMGNEAGKCPRMETIERVRRALAYHGA
jgi:uncharacterized protein YcaQ